MLTKIQCIESCRRSSSNSHASINFDDSTCYCLKELPVVLSNSDFQNCNNKPHWIYEISAYPESPSCDDLYFKKQVLFWGTYKIDGQPTKCIYSKPASTGDYSTEKLARNSIMFSDKLSRDNPAQGIQIRRGWTDAKQNLWSSSDDIVVFPWQLNSGFLTRTSSENWFVIKFGEPDRSALIWGIQFMRQQVETISGDIVSKIAYKYHKDVERGASEAAQLRDPLTLTGNSASYTISLADIDANGLHFFKDSSGNPLILTASLLLIEFSYTGHLNFDLVGSIYDFTKASTGADDWDNHVIGNFWFKGW